MGQACLAPTIDDRPHIQVDISTQQLKFYQGQSCIKIYSISSAKKGVGEQKNSEQTPRGHHIIRAKIGAGLPKNTIFVARRPTGELYSPALAREFSERDWILTRILWLSGLERGKNRLGNVDSMQRYIYIHGAPDAEPMGVPGSHGCIRMHNQDIIELFNLTPIGTKVDIHAQ